MRFLVDAPGMHIYSVIISPIKHPLLIHKRIRVIVYDLTTDLRGKQPLRMGEMEINNNPHPFFFPFS